MSTATCSVQVSRRGARHATRGQQQAKHSVSKAAALVVSFTAGERPCGEHTRPWCWACPWDFRESNGSGHLFLSQETVARLPVAPPNPRPTRPQCDVMPSRLEAHLPTWALRGLHLAASGDLKDDHFKGTNRCLGPAPNVALPSAGGHLDLNTRPGRRGSTCDVCSSTKAPGQGFPAQKPLFALEASVSVGVFLMGPS